MAMEYSKIEYSQKKVETLLKPCDNFSNKQTNKQTGIFLLCLRAYMFSPEVINHNIKTAVFAVKI